MRIGLNPLTSCLLGVGQGRGDPLTSELGPGTQRVCVSEIALSFYFKFLFQFLKYLCQEVIVTA